ALKISFEVSRVTVYWKNLFLLVNVIIAFSFLKNMKGIAKFYTAKYSINKSKTQRVQINWLQAYWN
ncbi:hypothetical protein, partial [Lactococcus lactis]|uniref:hypothetical protein n=1 Tax=Lactococcus lactis TaxID=1358 RepID=UPI001F3FA071